MKPKGTMNSRCCHVRVTASLLIFFLALAVSPSRGLCQEQYSLEDLYRIALSDAARIRIATEDVYLRQREKDEAIAALVPKVTGTAETRKYSEREYSSTGTSIAQPENTTILTARVSQSFSTGGRELIALKIANNRIQQSKYDLETVRADYLLRVAQTYYEVFRTQRNIEIATANVSRLTKYRDAAQTRLKVGEVTKVAVLRAEAALSGALASLAQWRSAHVFARAVLARTVGIEENFILKPSPEPGQEQEERQKIAPLIDECPAADLQCFTQLAMDQRPELRSLERTLLITGETVRFTKGSYWPTVTVEGVLTKRDDYPPGASLVRESKYAGIRLEVPIFDAGLRKAQISEAQTRQRQAIVAYNDFKLSVGIEVQNAFLALKTQADILTALENQVAYATDNFNSVTKQFDAGLATSTDVMDANTELVTAEQQLADGRYNLQLAIVQLKRATGGLLKTVTNGTKNADRENNPG